MISLNDCVEGRRSEGSDIVTKTYDGGLIKRLINEFISYKLPNSEDKDHVS